MNVTTCSHCKHFVRLIDGTSFCHAFPNEIPQSIRYSHYSYLYHYKPIEGQVGDYVFEFENYNDEVAMKFFYLFVMRQVTDARQGVLRNKELERDILQWAADNAEMVEKIEKFYVEWKKKKEAQ